MNKPTKRYVVTVQGKYDKNPGDIQVLARTKEEAVKRAREHMRVVLGHTRQDGPLVYGPVREGVL